MQTIVLPIDPIDPDGDVIRRAADVLRGGGLVAFPTETVYGLGANALDAKAVQRIFVAKGRPTRNPLIVHAEDVSAARQLVTHWPENAERLAARFWPGPLTLVLPKQTHVPDEATGGGPTVGVRVPAHPVARAILRESGFPIAAPSANRSNQLSPTLARHVLRDLRDRIEMLLDGGATARGLESTVLDLSATPPRLLRPGLVTPVEIEAEIGPIQRGEPERVAPSGPLPAPGMLERHYAPRAILECVEGDSRPRVESLCQSGVRVGWLTTTGSAELQLPGLIAVAMPAEPAAYAARLFAALHELDDAGVERIVVSLPPETDAWLAVRDRLHRGSAK